MFFFFANEYFLPLWQTALKISALMMRDDVSS